MPGSTIERPVLVEDAENAEAISRRDSPRQRVTQRVIAGAAGLRPAIRIE
jgi:hypothetical protein